MYNVVLERRMENVWSLNYYFYYFNKLVFNYREIILFKWNNYFRVIDVYSF